MLTDATSDRDWEKVARLPLYRSKRCEELARLLSAEQTLRLSEIDRSGLAEAIATNEGSSAVEFLIRTARSVRVGTNIADLTVCGAIAPYGPLLGGKLAALLAVSPRVIRAYRSRYTGNASLIASAMAGRALERAADLVYVSTSSLYGSRPCQYDRISIACEHIGGKEGFLKYRSLGTTEGFGSFQFSDATMVTINQLLRSTKNGQRVNYVFGEGASPKFRNLRDALVLLGFDADALLQHKHRRSVFGVSLIENLTGYLLGQERSPRYVYSLRSVKNAEDGIVNWWRNRWLAPRLMREGVLDSLREHTFVYPIEHGGRVKLPRVDIEQGVLF